MLFPQFVLSAKFLNKDYIHSICSIRFYLKKNVVGAGGQRPSIYGAIK